jgi:hypothetical protein
MFARVMIFESFFVFLPPQKKIDMMSLLSLKYSCKDPLWCKSTK